MNSFAYPKLKNNRTGTEIEINVNPFSIGRGMSCNYILPSKTVSRIHCVLEKNEDDTWVLKDTSTNGTFINSQLIKQVKSLPLKNNDVISFELEGIDTYTFVNESGGDEISDEQLCAIADTVLSEMEILNSNPVTTRNDEQTGAASLSLRRAAPHSPSVNPLLDHIYTSNEVTKKARMGRSPRPILGRTNIDGTSHSSGNANNPAATGEDVPASGRMGDFLTSDDIAYLISDSSDASLQRRSSSQSNDGAVSNLAQKEGGNSEGGVAGKKTGLCPWPSEGSDSTPRLESLASDQYRVQPGPSTEKVEKPELQDNYEVMENELQCAICSELFIKALTLNCSHTFCKYCINMWNKNKSDCPICRTKITSTTATIVLDNVIEKMIENSNDDIKSHRQMVLEERKNQEEAENSTTTASQTGQRGAGRGRRRGRGRGGRRARGGRGNQAQDGAPRINVLDPVAINIGALMNNVIELSSDSDWSSDTESMSADDLREEYDQDDWYDMPRRYWGGYGYCFRCGSPTHWANACPNR